MGRSTASCLKIITCGSDSVENDDLQAPENKGSSDKRGWSFRKRSSSRHRVLSNTVISEMPASNKESSETSTVNLQTQATTTFTEKIPAMPWTENTPKLSTLVNLEVSDNRVAAKDDTIQDVPLDESVIVVIQAAVRGVLAQKEMLKLKNIVRLQAVVRGHLVRRHAVGTLRCLQAIVKLQTLVRTHHIRLTFKGSYTEVNPDGNHGKEIKNLLTKPSVVVGTSMEKLLSNKFVHQLLESTPKTKRIHIKCDPSRSDSAWKWLERWMSASSVGVECSQKPESRMVQQEQDEVECDASQVEGVFPAESCESTNVEDNTTASLVPSKSEENLIGYDEDNFVFQARQTTSSAKIDDVEPPQPENPDLSTAKEGCLELLHSQTQKDSVSQLELKSNETDSEQSTRCMKRSAPEQGETEGRKYAFGTRKATNPAFIAVQSKFEELSSTANSARSTSSYKQDDGIEINSDTVSSSMDAGLRTTETDLAENSLLHTSSVKVGTSECGTEISVSSTLDSPDRIEIGMIDIENEIELSDEETSDAANTKKVDIEANNGETSILGSYLVDSLSVQPEKRDTVNEDDDDEHVNPVTAEDSLMEKEKSETNASNSAQIELDPHTGHEMYRSSPEASPRSHMTVPEPQETPSSQVSVKAKRTKRNRSSSDQKRRSFSAGKSSPSNPIQDSGVRNSLEQLPKDHKSGKRRNSFGSGRPDYVDQEPRDSNASNSLPSYMQATESAKAKALANSSPRSSPDVQDKEIYIKKRHSLPGANGRQGSPRIQRPTSRAQQGANGNGLPHERKWQR